MLSYRYERGYIMKNKKNKGLVWLVVILIILVLGLVGYIVYEKVYINGTNKNNNNTTTTNINNKNKWEEALDFKCLNEEVDRECVVYDTDAREIKLTNYKDVYDEKYAVNYFTYSILLNDEEIKKNIPSLYGYADYIYELVFVGDLIGFVHEYSTEYIMYIEDGTLVKNFDDYNELNCYNVNYQTGKYAITDSKECMGWGASSYCGQFEETEIFEIKKVLNDLGNGNLKEQTISKKTLGDLLYEQYGLKTCDEVDKFYNNN